MRANNVPRLQRTCVGPEVQASPDKRLRMISHHSSTRHQNRRHLEFGRSGKQISNLNEFLVILGLVVLMFRVR